MKRVIYSLLITSGLALLLAPVALADGAGDPITGSGVTSLEAWEGVVAIVIPWVAALAIQTHWSAQVKQIVAWVIAGAAGTVAYGLVHGWHINDGHFVLAMFTVLTGSKVFYEKYKTTFGLAKLEAKTSKPPR